MLGAQGVCGKEEMRARLAWHFYREGTEEGGDMIRFVFLEDSGGWWGADYS